MHKNRQEKAHKTKETKEKPKPRTDNAQNPETKDTQDEEKQSENTTQYGRFHYSTCSELLSKHEKSMYIQYLRLVVYLIHPLIITFEEIVTCRH